MLLFRLIFLKWSRWKTEYNVNTQRFLQMFTHRWTIRFWVQWERRAAMRVIWWKIEKKHVVRRQSKINTNRKFQEWNQNRSILMDVGRTPYNAKPSETNLTHISRKVCSFSTCLSNDDNRMEFSIKRFAWIKLDTNSTHSMPKIEFQWALWNDFLPQSCLACCSTIIKISPDYIAEISGECEFLCGDSLHKRKIFKSIILSNLC